MEPIYPDAVTPIAWDDDKPIEKARGVVYLVTGPCRQLRVWASQLRELHEEDKSYETQPDISRLSAQPIQAKNLGKVGKWEIEFYGADYARLMSARRARHACVAATFIAILLDKVGGCPVGFVSFKVAWRAPAAIEGDDELDLELEPDQAWIAPKYRYRSWGTLAAIGMATAIKRHVDQLEKTARWPRDFGLSPMKIFVSADVYSTSGDRWLRSFAQYVSVQFNFWDLDHLEVSEIELESRI